MSKLTPPGNNEIELSLFGPGRGECLLLHVGDGGWVVIDSCMNEAGDKAIAVEYLETLGVNICTQIKLVLVTHWHDDHIRGVSQILRLAPSARFACSAAFRTKEFFRLIGSVCETRLVGKPSGGDEFASILGLRESDKKKESPRLGPHHWVADTMTLFTSSDGRVKVTAISPSAQTITDCIGAIGSLLPLLHSNVRRFRAVGPNDQSIVLLVETPSVNLLLGGDLEVHSDELRGWHAVVASSTRPQCRSDVYKVAHHGSDNADHQSIWKSLLSPNPLALLTPYTSCATPLPTEADVERIKQRAAAAFCTVYPPTKKASRLESSVERLFKKGDARRVAIRKRAGHIRLRLPIGKAPEESYIELFDGAVKL